ELRFPARRVTHSRQLLMTLTGAVRAFLLATMAASLPVADGQHTPEERLTTASAVDGTRGPEVGSPALTGARHPLYRLHKSDVVEIKFTFSPEFDQTVTVLPDGFVTLKSIGDLPAEGLTLSAFKDSLTGAYATILRDPEISVVLKEFDHPFFVAGGQVGRPGKYELRSPTSLSEAISIAGGFTEQAKHSQ